MPHSDDHLDFLYNNPTHDPSEDWVKYTIPVGMADFLLDLEVRGRPFQSKATYNVEISSDSIYMSVSLLDEHGCRDPNTEPIANIPLSLTLLKRLVLIAESMTIDSEDSK